MRCTNCDTPHFPRTDPAVIMLVTHRDADGSERALLARNARFVERRVFSTLAGFVEPGESLEETVVREVAEECGVRVTRVRYHSSQPWPFPASIMLGFVAETADATITIDGTEIVEAGFFTRAEIRAHDQHGFALPPRMSIARRLIEDWCGEEE
jgi:NAD+ diphosphatase